MEFIKLEKIHREERWLDPIIYLAFGLDEDGIDCFLADAYAGDFIRYGFDDSINYVEIYIEPLLRAKRGHWLVPISSNGETKVVRSAEKAFALLGQVVASFCEQDGYPLIQALRLVSKDEGILKVARCTFDHDRLVSEEYFFA